MARPSPRVVLVGPMGAGKTTVAELLAEPGGASRCATPTATSRRSPASAISDIFVDDGEARFRELERAAVAEALAEHPGVLALGGGAVLDPRTRAPCWTGTAWCSSRSASPTR